MSIGWTGLLISVIGIFTKMQKQASKLLVRGQLAAPVGGQSNASKMFSRRSSGSFKFPFPVIQLP
jgi:hypothetical protein